MHRADPEALAQREFDLIVIGGGITGVAAARDAALRGLSVLLVEKDDFAAGTSSRSTKLIHGGLRYLETYQFKMVAESLQERERMLRLAPHLTEVRPFLYLLYRGYPETRFKLSLGLTFYDAASGQWRKRRHAMLNREQVLEHEPHLNPEGLLGAGRFYDVLTDDDLHAEGLEALKPYRVVINGTHAEYYSERMLDATEDYLAQGGRVMYLSGNGYYWVVGWRDDEPWLMEVRKLEAGSRAWQARAGEHYLASTGERSGLWRHRGRPPQKVVGTGFASEGMDESVPFRRMPDSWHKSVAWIFDGVQGDVIGDFGLAGNGAAGVEIDRYDLTLGTPPHARILASSEQFSDNYPLVQEEIMYNHPGMGGTQHPGVRCDMVYFTTPQHGAVFAPSSIAWGQALPCKGFDNNVSRVMKNVLDAFAKAGPLPGGEYIGDEKLWR